MQVIAVVGTKESISFEMVLETARREGVLVGSL